MRIRASLLALLVALPCVAREPQRYGFRYEAHLDCSSHQDLKERVRRHTSRAELVEAGAGDAEVTVVIAEEASGFRATVSLVVRGGRGFTPTMETRLRERDQLLVVTTVDARQATEDRIRAVDRRGRLARWRAEPESGEGRG